MITASKKIKNLKKEEEEEQSNMNDSIYKAT
jgi:hypothetical protein